MVQPAARPKPSKVQGTSPLAQPPDLGGHIVSRSFPQLGTCSGAGFREDTGDMDRGRAETHLRQLAESGFAAKVFPVIFGSKWQEIFVVI